LPAFRASVAARGGEVVEVPAGTASALVGDVPGTKLVRFAENLDLVCAAARALGIDDRAVRAGVQRSRGDIGSLRIWRYRPDESEPCFLVNAFAANDPESTALVHDGVMAALDLGPDHCVGLLNLRPDRGDRTLQWVSALRQGFSKRFARLYVIGLHARAVERRLRRFKHPAPVEVIEFKDPVETTQTVLARVREVGGVAFGFGNIAGPGEALIAHWDAVGEPIEV
jgi:hypothetical protein